MHPDRSDSILKSLQSALEGKNVQLLGGCSMFSWWIGLRYSYFLVNTVQPTRFHICVIVFVLLCFVVSFGSGFVCLFV